MVDGGAVVVVVDDDDDDDDDDPNRGMARLNAAAAAFFCQSREAAMLMPLHAGGHLATQPSGQMHAGSRLHSG